MLLGVDYSLLRFKNSFFWWLYHPGNVPTDSYKVHKQAPALAGGGELEQQSCEKDTGCFRFQDKLKGAGADRFAAFLSTQQLLVFQFPSRNFPKCSLIGPAARIIHVLIELTSFLESTFQPRCWWNGSGRNSDRSIYMIFFVCFAVSSSWKRKTTRFCVISSSSASK